MGYPSEVRKFSFVSPPRAYGAAGPVGQVVSLATSTTPSYIDLQTLTFGLIYDPADTQKTQGAGAPPGIPNGVVGAYLSIYADAADVGVIFGPTLNSVLTSASATKTGTHGSIATASAGSAVFTDATASSFVAGDVGKYLIVTGAHLAQNNGAFLITAYGSATHVTIANPYALATGETNNGSLGWSEYALTNAPVLATTGTVVSGAYVAVPGVCWRIPAGNERRYLLQIGQDNYMGFVGSAAGIIRIAQSSGYGIEGE